ncbi:MAG: AAA family ATPase [Bacteroidales bacterium]|nr:AAA family ATPase [Bacteroidales bacterium]
MELLFEKFKRKLGAVSLNFVRHPMEEIHWNNRLTGIKGARGIGKTTLLLQYIRKNLPTDESVLYVSLDDLWFSANTLVGLADSFTKYGGKYLFLDEVHKYPNWSAELKNIYDDYPELKVVFTGSSLLEIHNSRVDLSRRADIYNMQGLSFREYLNFVTGSDFSSYSLKDILTNHLDISKEITKQFRPLKYFASYLKEGYYPFFAEDTELYPTRLSEILNLILEFELPVLRGVDIKYTSKLKLLLIAISESAPFIPNVSKLSERTGLNRNTLVNYLHYLGEADILINIYKAAHGITRLQKPDKILIENSNLSWVLSQKEPDKGSIRETFFINQIGYRHLVNYPDKADYIVDGEYLFEVGGKNKTNKQLTDWNPNKKFIVSDDIEFGFKNKIPLWIMGFLY